MLLWILIFLFCVCSGMQYVSMIASTSSTDNIHNWIVSSVSDVDDSPFERVELPVIYLF